MAIKLEPGINDLEYYCNRIDDTITEFCLEYNIQDLEASTQNKWNACIKYIYNHVFKPIDKTLLRDSKCNSIIDYNNIELLNGLLEYYIYLCNLYSKAVNIVSFCTMIGVSRTAIYDWNNGRTKELNSAFGDIYKTLDKAREESLSDLLISGKKQPIGLLAVLNHEKGWNLPGSSKEVVHISAKEAPEKIAERYKSALTDSQLSDNSGQNED